MDRGAWAKKQSTRCDPTRERFKPSAEFPPHSAVAGGRAFLIHEPLLGRPWRASPATAFRVPLDAFFRCHDLVPQSVEERGKVV
jgi:hypothetical protein